MRYTINDKRISVFEFRFVLQLHSLFLLVCFTLLTGFLNAQVVIGKVNGKQNNELSPIPGAIVQISGGGGSSASASAVLAGNNGILRTYYYTNGVKTILNPINKIL
jgi:hypothetical protein